MVTEPTYVTGQPFDDAAAVGGPRVNIDYRMQLIKQRESAAPYLSLMLHLNSENVLTHKFGTFQTRPNPKKAILSGSVIAAATANATKTWAVASTKGKYYAAGDIVTPSASLPADATESNIGYVVSVSGDNLTVRANDPALKICAVTDGEEIRIVGRSFAQGTLSATAMASVPELKTFYTQIFKHDWQVTRTHANNRMYGAPERDRLRGETEIEHLSEIAKMLYIGDGVLDTTNFTHPRTTLTGLFNQITDNVLSYGATLDETEFFDFMTTLHQFRYATDGKMSRRLVMASASVLNDVHKIALKYKQEMGVITKFGLDISQFVWAGRTWDFVEDPNLTQFWPGYAVVIQPRYVKMREFLPTQLQGNIQPNNADYFEDQFITELGQEVQLSEMHGIMKPG